jgi:hypothetical protein
LVDDLRVIRWIPWADDCLLKKITNSFCSMSAGFAKERVSVDFRPSPRFSEVGYHIQLLVLYNFENSLVGVPFFVLFDNAFDPFDTQRLHHGDRVASL